VGVSEREVDYPRSRGRRTGDIDRCNVADRRRQREHRIALSFRDDAARRDQRKERQRDARLGSDGREHQRAPYRGVHAHGTTKLIA
jgi:hypothetical protein